MKLRAQKRLERACFGSAVGRTTLSGRKYLGALRCDSGQSLFFFLKWPVGISPNTCFLTAGPGHHLGKLYCRNLRATSRPCACSIRPHTDAASSCLDRRWLAPSRGWRAFTALLHCHMAPVSAPSFLFSASRQRRAASGSVFCSSSRILSMMSGHTWKSTPAASASPNRTGPKGAVAMFGKRG